VERRKRRPYFDDILVGEVGPAAVAAVAGGVAVDDLHYAVRHRNTETNAESRYYEQNDTC
jgi:hypothetical protein